MHGSNGFDGLNTDLVFAAGFVNCNAPADPDLKAHWSGRNECAVNVAKTGGANLCAGVFQSEIQ